MVMVVVVVCWWLLMVVVAVCWWFLWQCFCGFVTVFQWLLWQCTGGCCGIELVVVVTVRWRLL